MTNILIVDEDVINSSKLKLVFSKYGSCDMTSNGNTALERIKEAHEAGEPYGIISLEQDMKEVPGNEAAAQIRAFEKETGKEKKSAVLLLLSEEKQEELAAFLEENQISPLLKPLNRKKLEQTLAKLGFEKEAAPPPEPASPARTAKTAPSAPAIPDAKVQVILKKLSAVIKNADKIEEPEFRHVIAELVKGGGKQAALALGQHILSNQVSVATRITLIRIAGRLKNPMLLVSLNRVADSEENIKLVEAAITAIARYSDQRALSILNNALKKLKNPMLLNTVRREMAKIKDNNPVLAILPRYLQSYKNKKTFTVTLDILKKIVTPEHSSLFQNYLKSGNEVIEDGTFELLCYAGDPAIGSTLFNFFEDRVQKIPCLVEKECYDLYMMTSHLQKYLDINPSLIDDLINELKELYPKVNDIRVKQIITALLSKSHNVQALSFIKSIYAQEEELQEWIVKSLSGNQQAVDFLFEKYHAGQEVKGQVVKSLLKSDQGLQYFVKHFFTFELDKQELIVKNLTYTHQPFMIDFVREIYKSSLYSLKCYLLHVLRDNFLFEFEDTLFDPEHQREFTFMGKDYMNTISRLYPVTTIKHLYQKIAFEDISYTKVKKYLIMIREIADVEPVLKFRDVKLVNNLFNKIVNANNVEMNTHFFQALENIKTLDLQTYKYLIESTNTFINVRGAQIQQKEKVAVAKFKQKLQEQIADIRDIENISKELNAVFANKPIERESLEKLIKTHHTAVALNLHRVLPYLAERLNKPEYISKDDRELLYVNLPTIAKFLDYYIADPEKAQKEGKQGLMSQFSNDFRIVISFRDKSLTALYKDQLREIIPDFPVTLDTPPEHVKGSDIILCDVPVLKTYVDKKVIINNRIYLYLENRAEYANYRDYKPKAFMQPVSAHRVIKMILKELYLD